MYLVPDPGLLLTTNASRADNFLENWLRIRILWLSMLVSAPENIEPLPSQWFRDFLAGNRGKMQMSERDNKTNRRKSEIQATLDRIFRKQGLQDLSYLWSGLIYFCDDTYTTVQDIPSAIRREIYWELYEVGFQHELIHMDRFLCPESVTNVSSRSALELRRLNLISAIFKYDLSPIRSRLIPDYLAPAGLSASNIRQRANSLEALRCVLARWPAVPDTIKFHPALDSKGLQEPMIAACEYAMACFYTQTFWRQAGRAPLIPHVPPPV